MFLHLNKQSKLNLKFVICYPLQIKQKDIEQEVNHDGYPPPLLMGYVIIYIILSIGISTTASDIQMNWGGGNSKKVDTHPKIPEIHLDFFRLH